MLNFNTFEWNDFDDVNYMRNWEYLRSDFKTVWAISCVTEPWDNITFFVQPWVDGSIIDINFIIEFLNFLDSIFGSYDSSNDDLSSSSFLNLFYSCNEASSCCQHCVSNDDYLTFDIRDSNIAYFRLESLLISLGTNESWISFTEYPLNTIVEWYSCSEHSNKDWLLLEHIMSGILTQHSPNSFGDGFKIVRNLQSNKLSNFLQRLSELSLVCIGIPYLANQLLD